MAKINNVGITEKYDISKHNSANGNNALKWRLRGSNEKVIGYRQARISPHADSGRKRVIS
jgi:hypothetical protein